MQTLGGLQLLALTMFAGVGLGAVISAFVVRWRSSSIQELSPGLRISRLRFWLFFPLVCGAVLSVLAVLPSALDAAGLVSDHCQVHPDHHFHLCFVHSSHLHPTGAGWIALGALAIVPAIRVWASISEFILAWARIRRLVELGRPRDDAAGVEIPSREVFAFACGIVEPTIVISRGLVDALESDALDVVEAHEWAHVRHRHLIWRGLVELAGAFHIPRVARWLRSEHALACEQVCDRGAARESEDPLYVAETLVRIERLTSRRPELSISAASSQVDGHRLERRVRCLLNSEKSVEPRRLWVGCWFAVIGFFVFYYQSIHHLLETIFAYVHGTFH